MSKDDIQDIRVRAIINDPLLPGREKARQVGELLKNRKSIQTQPPFPIVIQQAHELKEAWVAEGFDNDGIQLYVGVTFCTHCLMATITREVTTAPDSNLMVAMSDIMLTTEDIGKYCEDEDGN